MRTKQERTKQEIQSEIAALKKLKPTGKFKDKTAATIARAIDELEGHGFDTTAAEFEELPDHERDMIQQALDWKDGWNNDKPSEGWGDLVAK